LALLKSSGSEIFWPGYGRYSLCRHRTSSSILNDATNQSLSMQLSLTGCFSR